MRSLMVWYTLSLIVANDANAYTWDCKFKSNIALWSVGMKSKYNDQIEADTVIGIRDVLRTLAQGNGEDLSRHEQEEIAEIVHFSYIDEATDKSPVDIAMDYFKFCVAGSK